MARALPAERRPHSPDPGAQPAPPRRRARNLALLGALLAAIAAVAAARACALLADAQAAARQVGGDRKGTVAAERGAEQSSTSHPGRGELGRSEGTMARTG